MLLTIFVHHTFTPPLPYKQNELHDWPLILAAGSGHLELVEQLHEFGGHVTRRHTLSRCTPLHVAARGGHKDVVKCVFMPTISMYWLRIIPYIQFV